MRWEYNTFKVKTHGVFGGIVDEDELQNQLDAYGVDGWELVSIFETNRSEGATRDVVVVFKRPVDAS